MDLGQARCPPLRSALRTGRELQTVAVSKRDRRRRSASRAKLRDMEVTPAYPGDYRSGFLPLVGMCRAAH